MKARDTQVPGELRVFEDEVTGSNLVIVGAADGARAMSVVNSGRPGDRDVDESTVFPIWSMSKPITIVAMMTLHEQGKFEWNDPVADYIPCFADLVIQVVRRVPGTPIPGINTRHHYQYQDQLTHQYKR